MAIRFFMPMIPPTVTHQEKSLTVRNGKPATYEKPELKAARAKLEAHLSKHRPDTPMTGPLGLIVKWCFPITGKHQDGQWKTTRPDTDNLQKLLKDCMTKVGFWKDDAQVCSEIIQKFWAVHPGIYIEVGELEEAYDPGSQI